MNRCSTPFGITGCYADGLFDQRLLFVVLNAFRHHRVLRDILLPMDEPNWECSTPFGITGCYAVHL